MDSSNLISIVEYPVLKRGGYFSMSAKKKQNKEVPPVLGWIVPIVVLQNLMHGAPAIPGRMRLSETTLRIVLDGPARTQADSSGGCPFVVQKLKSRPHSGGCFYSCHRY